MPKCHLYVTISACRSCILILEFANSLDTVPGFGLRGGQTRYRLAGRHAGIRLTKALYHASMTTVLWANRYEPPIRRPACISRHMILAGKRIRLR